MTPLRSISSFTSRLAISLVILAAAPTLTAAQTASPPEEEKKEAWFQGLELSVDVVGPAMLALGDYGAVEAALRMNIKGKYFPIVEIGYADCEKTEETTSLTYTTSAPYYRIGCDFNILRDKHDIYRLYIGVRYAYTTYEYDLSHPGITDPVWGGTSEYSIIGESASYSWFEALAGVQAKICGPLHLGWSLRYKSRISSDEGSLGKSWYVPGYGTSDSSGFGATFNIIFVL